MTNKKCKRCEAEKRGLNSLALHSCGKTTAETPENEKLSTIKKCCEKLERCFKCGKLVKFDKFSCICPCECHQTKPQEVDEKNWNNEPCDNKNCPMCQTVNELVPSMSYCAKHNYKKEGCGCYPNSDIVCSKHSKEEVAKKELEKMGWKFTEEVAERIPFVADSGSYPVETGYHYSEEVADWAKELHDICFQIDCSLRETKVVENSLKNLITKTIAQEYDRGYAEAVRRHEKEIIEEKEKWKEELIEWCEKNKKDVYGLGGGYDNIIHLSDIINKIKNNEG